MIRVKSNIGPSGGGFGYHIDMAPLHEQPDVEATRIVWELLPEGTARDLLNSAEGEQDGKITTLTILLMICTGHVYAMRYSSFPGLQPFENSHEYQEQTEQNGSAHNQIKQKFH